MFYVSFLMTDARGLSTDVSFAMGDFGWGGTGAFDFALANSAATQLQNALGNASDAEITSMTISYVDTGTAATHPITGQADVTDEIYVSYVLNDVKGSKFGARIPAPSADLLLADGITPNPDQTTFANFTQQVLDHTRHGGNLDVELVDPAEIYNTYWRSVAKRKRK